MEGYWFLFHVENEAVTLKELEQRINDTLVPFSKHLEEKLKKPKMIKEFIGFGEKLFQN